MAKKPAKKVAAKSPSTAKPPHKESPLHHLEQIIESRFFEGAEMATETTSAETNVALAALAATEGPREPKTPKGKAANAKRKSPRPKKR
jgi:hypothetical protein